jgi:hypothetical protein
MPVALNAANEVAVEAFLEGRLAFPAIAQVIDETLRVTATLNDGGELRFERPALDCRDSMLVMGTDWKHSIQEEGGAEALGMTMGMFHWFERTSWKLARAEDGSLLMRKSEGGSLMLYWFPVLPGWETTWMDIARRSREIKRYQPFSLARFVTSSAFHEAAVRSQPLRHGRKDDTPPCAASTIAEYVRAIAR